MADVVQNTADKLGDNFKNVIHVFQNMAPQAWHILVAKNRLEGVCNLFAMITCLLVSIFLVPRFIKKISAYEKNDDDFHRYNNLRSSDQENETRPQDLRSQHAIHAILMACIGVVALVGSCIYFFYLGDILQHIFIPEYSAAQEVITTLSK